MLFYRIFSIFLYPFLKVYLFFRVLRKKEDKNRLNERFGKALIQRPKGDIIWVHAVSVGEANSALILIEEILKTHPKISILFTTTTLASAGVIGKKILDFNGQVIHQFFPLDSYKIVKEFFAFWKFKAVIFIESEIWPNMLYESKRLEIPCFLVNARISKKSFKKWNFAKKIGFNVFDYFDKIFVQMREDKESLEKLTKKESLFYGNLKSQAPVLKYNLKKLEELKSQIGDRKFWLAASTHKGEEDLILKVHKKLAEVFPDILTLLVIRHPYRSQEVRQLIEGENFKSATRSKGEKITSQTKFYIGDTMGEMGIYYKMAHFTFLGGSLLEIGGHNPFEPIKLDCAVISGRGVFNFKEIYDKLESQKACVMIDDVDEIFNAAKNFIEDKKLSSAIAKKAFDLTEKSDNIARKIILKINEIVSF